MKTPRPAPYLGTARLGIYFDPTRNGKHYWAILCEKPLYGTKLVGWRRGPGENFAGLYAYRFKRWSTAARITQRLFDMEPIQDGKA